MESEPSPYPHLQRARVPEKSGTQPLESSALLVPYFLGSVNLGVGYSVHLVPRTGAACVCVCVCVSCLPLSQLPLLLLLGGLCLKVASVP